MRITTNKILELPVYLTETRGDIELRFSDPGACSEKGISAVDDPIVPAPKRVDRRLA